VHGRVIFRESPSPEHQQVFRNLTIALLATRPASPCMDVLQDTDMRYRHRNPHVADEGKRVHVPASGTLPKLSTRCESSPIRDGNLGSRPTRRDAFTLAGLTREAAGVSYQITHAYQL
jgi:hypothetical protein